MRDKLDDFIRAVAQNQMSRLDAELARKFLFEIKRIAVGVKVDGRNGLLHCGQGERRGAERIFVGRDLDNGSGGQIQFAGDFFNRAARLIRRQIFEKRI